MQLAPLAGLSCSSARLGVLQAGLHRPGQPPGGHYWYLARPESTPCRAPVAAAAASTIHGYLNRASRLAQRFPFQTDASCQRNGGFNGDSNPTKWNFRAAALHAGPHWVALRVTNHRIPTKREQACPLSLPSAIEEHVSFS